jgi:hypothetical protein
MIDLINEKPLSLHQVQTMFDVSRPTVVGWMKRGLEHVRIGKRIYTSLEAIQRLSTPGMHIVFEEEDEMAPVERVLEGIDAM